MYSVLHTEPLTLGTEVEANVSVGVGTGLVPGVEI